ncbi:hypothetical protein [Azospirillum picis]|uniref:Uncharacterized protein n=1 Tax=Azospirillum picis TaxID=488438 RepID=A0ABU0MN39_9PROT|nr:hypothetical protein [Azospirillum picis]MBP2301155.1 hypothetical protein [Azospirillum picis]MDQ0534883.1 hypothetical protein [Azospirillum picis]
MIDKPTDDQPVPGEVNRQAPQQPETPPGRDNGPTEGGAPHPKTEKADERAGQTREPGYDEA